MGSEMQPGVMRAQKRNLLVMKFLKSCDLSIDQKFYAEFKIVYFMGSKVQSKAIRAQKRNWFVMKF
jgi:hypothetical protein